jgi:hypothetical protein
MKIEAAKEEVTKRSKRVKCTSVLLVIFGGLGACMSLWKYFNAGSIANHIVSRGSHDQRVPDS